MKRKDDTMNDMMDKERSRLTAANLEKKEWDDARVGLEDQLADAQTLGLAPA